MVFPCISTGFHLLFGDNIVCSLQPNKEWIIKLDSFLSRLKESRYAATLTSVKHNLIALILQHLCFMTENWRLHSAGWDNCSCASSHSHSILGNALVVYVRLNKRVDKERSKEWVETRVGWNEKLKWEWYIWMMYVHSFMLYEICSTLHMQAHYFDYKGN